MNNFANRVDTDIHIYSPIDDLLGGGFTPHDNGIKVTNYLHFPKLRSFVETMVGSNGITDFSTSDPRIGKSVDVCYATKDGIYHAYHELTCAQWIFNSSYSNWAWGHRRTSQYSA